MPLETKDPGHPFSETQHISFGFYTQVNSPAPFGYDYFLSLPPSYDSIEHETYPLILFLHGAGESQRSEKESYRTLRHGVPKIILCYDKWKSTGSSEPPVINIPLVKRLRDRNPNRGKSGAADLSTTPVPHEVCELVAENFITINPSLNMENGYGWNATVLSALLDEVISTYRVDTARMHVTGFSMGGYGTWAMGLHEPERFATLTPVCGGGDAILVQHLKHVPQWVHHGDKDDIVPVSASEKMVDTLKQNGADSVRFTRYPELTHDSWTEAYNNPEVWRWMLSHKAKGRAVVDGAGDGKTAQVVQDCEEAKIP